MLNELETSIACYIGIAFFVISAAVLTYVMSKASRHGEDVDLS